MTSLPDDAPHLLIVDDDSRIRALLRRFLNENGYRVSTAENAAEARERLALFAFDLLILDWMLPGESGLSLAKDIRTTSALPILMLTARGELDDRLKGLEAGIDDYLPKPFDPRELLLRINAILRRVAMPPPRQDTPSLPDPVQFGVFTYHIQRGELLREGQPIHLTERERGLLTLLAQARSQTVPREALIGEGAQNARSIDVQINRLRRKLGDDGATPLHLQTVRGVGYRLVLSA